METKKNYREVYLKGSSDYAYTGFANIEEAIAFADEIDGRVMLAKMKAGSDVYEYVNYQERTFDAVEVICDWLGYDNYQGYEDEVNLMSFFYDVWQFDIIVSKD